MVLFRSLAAECASQGVIIQTLCPGFVATKLSAIRRESLFSPTPEQFVRSAIERISLPWTTGYWPHELQVNSVSVFFSILNRTIEICV